MANKSNKKLVESNAEFLALHARILAAIWAIYFLIRVVYCSDTMDSWQWAACFASTGTEVLVFYQFYTMSRPSYSSTGALLDGGLDLNQPGGLTDYMRDAFYVAMGSQVLSIVTDGAWYLLLLVPTIGCYKLWTSVLQPLMFNR